MASYTDGRGHTTTYAYDAAGNLTAVTQPGDVETDYGRDSGGTGLLASLTDPRGQTTTYTYDGDANLASVIAPTGDQTTFEYDAAGRRTSMVDPRGNATGADPGDYKTTSTYDDADRLTSVTDPLGHTTTTTYDAVGNRTSVTDANDHSTTYTYDPDNRLASVTDPTDATTSYAYDAVSHLVTRTDANDHVTTYAYDHAGRLTGVTDPLERETTITYDAAGNPATRTDATGQTTTYTYDVLNRVTAIDYADAATPDVTFAYDANGNQTAMSDGAGTQTATFDDLDRLTGVTRGSDEFAYAYDDASNLTSRTYPDGTVVGYTYDDAGRLASVTADSATTTYTYDPASQLTGTDLPNGVTETRTYDSTGRVTTIAAAGPAHTLTSLAYTYDPAGNLTQLMTGGSATSERASVASDGSQAGGADTSAPTAPSDLTAAASGASEIDLTWTASTDDVGVVRYRVSRDGAQLIEVAGTATAFVDHSVAPSTEYAYTVVAVDAAGNAGAASSPASATTPSSAGSLDAQVGASYDDMYAYATGSGSGSYARTSGHVFAADHTATAYDYASGLRFTSITVPAGATITAASVSLTADASQASPPPTTLSGQAADDAADFASDDDTSFNARTRTTASVSWTPAAWSSGTTYTSPDLASVLQEIVDRAGWSSGNAVVLFWSDPTTGWGGTDSRLSAASYDGSPTEAASLHLEYTTGGTDTNAPSIPTALAASANGASEIDLTWSASTDDTAVQGYRIYRDSSLLATTAGTSYADTGLAAGASHSYTLAAIDGSGNASDQSTSASAITDASGPAASQAAAISADGRWVVFSSAADNLVSGDTNGATDVFVHDRLTGITQRVSVSSTGAEADSDSEQPAISADGRYVAFRSAASNLVTGDTNGAWDIFVHDRATGATQRVSVSSSGAQGTGTNRDPALSADGRYVAFASTSANLVAGDTNSAQDIFVHDRLTGDTTRVSVDASGTQADADSHNPAISADGQTVAFDSDATNLVSGDTNGARDIFVRDLSTGTTTRVSVDASGTQANADSHNPAISADGSLVAFDSGATNLVAGDSNARTDIFLRDRMASSTTRIDLRPGGAQTSRDSELPAISPDGRYLAYDSTDTGLVSGDSNTVGDVFELDRSSGTTTRLSVDASGSQADGASTAAALADGGVVAFASDAANLVAADTNTTTDLFVHGALAAQTSYTYDAADRLTGACGDAACVASLAYTYDPLGNRLTGVAPGGTTTYTYDAADELTSLSNPAGAETDYTYDAAGRQTAAGADSFAYDDANRLTSASVGGVSHTYTYAGDGRRLSASDDGTTTDFVWDLNFGLPQLVTETNSAGASLRDYTYGLGLTPLSLNSDSATAYLTTDALGSVLASSDADGAVQTATSYQPFGAILTVTQASTDATDNPMAFTGQYLDPTGLYHLRARQYDPTTGRFLTTDPLGPTGSGLGSLYAYGSNSPLRFTDPSGLCDWFGCIGDAWNAATGAVGTAAGWVGDNASLVSAGTGLAAIAVAPIPVVGQGAALALGGISLATGALAVKEDVASGNSPLVTALDLAALVPGFGAEFKLAKAWGLERAANRAAALVTPSLRSSDEVITLEAGATAYQSAARLAAGVSTEFGLGASGLSGLASAFGALGTGSTGGGGK